MVYRRIASIKAVRPAGKEEVNRNANKAHGMQVWCYFCCWHTAQAKMGNAELQARAGIAALHQNGSALSEPFFQSGLLSLLFHLTPNWQERHSMFSWCFCLCLPFSALHPPPSLTPLHSSDSPLPTSNMYRFYGSLENKWLSFHRWARM